MNDGLDLPLRYRKELEALLRRHVPNLEVWAYGSRVNRRSHEGSDLDLVLRSPTLEPLSATAFLDLVEALEQSSIPIIVQAHDWAMLPESFHREIERDYVVVQAGKEPGAADGWIQCNLADACSEINYGLTASASDVAVGPKFLRACSRSLKYVKLRLLLGEG
jgi:predicted nucleotidyltransferase